MTIQKFYVGQRVIAGDEIGVVTRPTSRETHSFDHWVFLPSRGYGCSFADHNVQPLPTGQL